jgi:DNA-binding MarR family transcriptional regulator
MRFHKLSLLNLASALLAVLISMPAFAGNWGEHETKLALLRQRVKDAETETMHLIEEKRNTHDQAAVKQIIEQIGISHEAFTKAAKQLEAEELHVRFKHPEHAEKADVKYTRRHTKSLDDMEAEVGLDGRLDKIKAQVLSTFPVPKLLEASHVDAKLLPMLRKPASVEDEDAPEKITLVK